VLTECRFCDISGDTLFVVTGNRIEPIPLTQVYQIRAVKNSSITDGLLLGSGCGVVLGSLLGLSLYATERSASSTGTTVLAFAVLGGIVGGTMAALEEPGDLVYLESKSADEKIRLIREVVRRASLERP
jgi:Na+/H+ antiporter NhaA